MDLILPTAYVIQKIYQIGIRTHFKKFTNVFEMECNACREGKSRGRSRRLYYITKDNFFYCQNCQRRWSPLQWILEFGDYTFQEVREEVKEFDETSINTIDEPEPEKIKMPTLPEDSINLFDKQQLQWYEGNPVVRDALIYIKKRRLDRAINKPRALFISLKDKVHKNRLCIPFYDNENQIQFYQTRAIYEQDEKFGKYLSKLNSEKTIYGIRNIDYRQDHLFLLEGPIDAMFVRNGLAMCGTNISSGQRKLLKKYNLYSMIWVLDNQAVDEAAREMTKKLIDRGATVFIWPKKYKEKDLNKLCVKHKLNQISSTFIVKNSFKGLQAHVRLN